MEFRLPDRKGSGMFAAAAGLYVLGAVGNVAAWQLYLEDCHPRDGERGDCLDGAVRFLGVTYGATTLTRGSWALAALGGDWLGEYRGSRDGWFDRPARPTRGLMAAGGVAFAVGVVVQVAGMVTFLRSNDCAGIDIDPNAERACIEPKVWSYVSMLTVGSGLYTVGSGLLGYGGAYKEAHGFWSRRRLNLALSTRNLGGALTLRF